MAGKSGGSKNPSAVARGRLGGKKGGPARAKALTSAEKAVEWAYGIMSDPSAPLETRKRAIAILNKARGKS